MSKQQTNSFYQVPLTYFCVEILHYRQLITTTKTRYGSNLINFVKYPDIRLPSGVNDVMLLSALAVSGYNAIINCAQHSCN